MSAISGEDHQMERRWRLILGQDAADTALTGADQGMDDALSTLYPGGDEERGRFGGSGASAPKVARWLGDIRRYFPSTVVRVMQKDALERFNLRQLLLEKEMLEAVEPDVNLVATLISLSHVIPQKTKETARTVVGKLVDKLMERLQEPMRAAVSGAVNRAVRNRRPRASEIDWPRTITANMKNYLPEYKTVIPEKLVGYGRKARSCERHIILCIDQSGSMAASVVYASIFGAVLASLPAVKTSLVLFDTAVVDMTDQLEDPVELLFGTQLGGGTDINRAIGYCQELVVEPAKTILVLISDLIEGGLEKNLLKRTASLIDSGVKFVTLLALSDEGHPAYDSGLAQEMAALGAPAFACTPDLFPDLMASAIRGEDIATWAAKKNIVTPRAANH